jgi:hypothetical protein
METRLVQWGNADAIRSRALRGAIMLAVGLMILLAVPIVLALDVVGSARSGALSGGVVAVGVVVAILGVAAAVIGFRAGLVLRGISWLQPSETGLELWQGRSRRPVEVLPWISVAAVGVTAGTTPVLWLRREPRQRPDPSSALGAVVVAAPGDRPDQWDLGIALDPACGDPRNLERDIAARVHAPQGPT